MSCSHTDIASMPAASNLRDRLILTLVTNPNNVLEGDDRRKTATSLVRRLLSDFYQMPRLSAGRLSAGTDTEPSLGCVLFGFPQTLMQPKLLAVLCDIHTRT
jgi:hypothetical protein